MGRSWPVVEAGTAEESEEPDTSCAEMDTQAAELADPEDWARIEAADPGRSRQTGKGVRPAQMGLP